MIIIEIKELNKDYKKNLHSTTFNIIMREQGPSQHGATKQIRDDRPVEESTRSQRTRGSRVTRSREMIGSRGAQNATRTGSIKALEENVEQVGQNEIQEDTGRVLMENTMVRDQQLANKNITDTSKEGESRVRE